MWTEGSIDVETILYRDQLNNTIITAQKNKTSMQTVVYEDVRAVVAVTLGTPSFISTPLLDKMQRAWQGPDIPSTEEVREITLVLLVLTPAALANPCLGSRHASHIFSVGCCAFLEFRPERIFGTWFDLPCHRCIQLEPWQSACCCCAGVFALNEVPSIIAQWLRLQPLHR